MILLRETPGEPQGRLGRARAGDRPEGVRAGIWGRGPREGPVQRPWGKTGGSRNSEKAGKAEPREGGGRGGSEQPGHRTIQPSASPGPLPPLLSGRKGQTLTSPYSSARRRTASSSGPQDVGKSP